MTFQFVCAVVADDHVKNSAVSMLDFNHSRVFILGSFMAQLTSCAVRKKRFQPNKETIDHLKVQSDIISVMQAIVLISCRATKEL